MTSGMTLKDLKLYFESNVDPEFYFFNPMHGWNVKDLKNPEFESPNFTLYQCMNKVWIYFSPEDIMEIFEICVTAGTSIFNYKYNEFLFSYIGPLGSHREYVHSTENLKLECIYFINELAKLEIQDPLEHAKSSLIDLLNIWKNNSY